MTSWLCVISRAPKCVKRVTRGRYIPVRYRRRVRKRAASWCEVRFEGVCLGGQDLEFHHRRMWAHGGRHTTRNLVLACDSCHSSLHHAQYNLAMSVGLLMARHPRRAWVRLFDRQQ